MKWKVISVLLIVTCGYYQVLAGNIYVDTNDPGCVSGSGQADPFAVVYCSLSDAVTDSVAGDFIYISPGLYPLGASIHLNDDNVSIIGPGIGIDPRPYWGSFRTSGSSGESIVDGSGIVGSIFIIEGDNISIQGVEVRNGTGDLVKQNDPFTGTDISYNIIHNSSGDEAIQLKSCSQCNISYNYTYFTEGDGMSYAESVDSQMMYNESRESHSEHGGIYIYGSQNITVTGNVVAAVSHYAQGHGIRWGAPGYGNTGGIMTDNIIIGASGAGISIEDSTGDGLVDIEISTNDIHQISQGPDDWAGIRILAGSSGILIEENKIYSNPMGIEISTSGGAPDATTVLVYHNDIYDNVTGVINNGTGLLMAEENWWGDPSGPLDEFGADEVPVCTDSPLTEINEDGLGNGAGDNIDYCPWLTAPYVVFTPTPSPTSTPTMTPTITPTSTPTMTPTLTPTNTSTPFPTYTPLPTLTPDPTYTPAPTYTPLPTHTPAPTATPDIPCEETGVELIMPSHIFQAGDLCFVTASVCNSSASILTDTPLMVVLDIHGEYWFAPSWAYFEEYGSRLDYYEMDFPPGYTNIQVVHEFLWPSDMSPVSGVFFYTALTNADLTEILGSMFVFEFGWM